jgi:hypothetical protein
MLDVHHQLTSEQLSCGFQAYPAGVFEQLRVQQNGRTVAPDPVVGIEILSR